ncbi:type III effector Hrp-dependent outer domain-containing protein [Pseudorhodoferax aquiterrae]|uniref:Type III effector Hrp-dependent outer domain-containing protein n=1 Tax=Pseudorhodoferax aquiterrae TaxID=747304 RepID=A0ABQ3G358_9BURK|nr:3-oxo-isoapionate kinase OiaK [Pseudorhodoferax aquiterrae]GHC86198.1 type III effector Hrp-dependent outer domain-containing protein [Pseudorhodoferax aquiterrae]
MAQALPPGLLLAYYGDDFTGSTDVLEAFAAAGVPTVLFLQTPDAAALARFPQARCVGLAGPSRGRDPAWMHAHLRPALQDLAGLGAPLLQYKICSTFDSSPAMGSIGCAVDIGVPLMPGRWSPMVVGAPRLGRYQAFGNLFAVADGQGWRLDRHPTMSRHPVTPMAEADLRRHLGAQTARPRALVDFTQLKAGLGAQALAQCLQAAAEPPVVLIDVLDAQTLCEAGRLVWEQRGAGVFTASSSGLQYALTAWWRAQGLLPEAAPLPHAGPAGRIAAVSGSCSPVTARQIDQAEADGFALLRIDLARALGAAAQAELARVCDAACAALDQGASPLLYTARGPDDPAVQAFDATAAAAGLSRAQAAQRTGEVLALLMRAVLDRVPTLRRIAVAGGDSSGEVAGALGITALTVAAGLAPGAPLCRAWSDLPQRDGLEIVLKGGQMGGADFFARVRDGTVAAAPG